MKEIVAFIEQKKQEFAKLHLFEFLANKNIHPNQRLIFAPLLAPFAVGLSDLNKYVLRESSSNNKVQELINKYTYKENYYWRWYLQHLETLGFNQLMSCGDFRLLWGEETQKTRSLCSVLERYAWKASPFQKLVLVKVLEATAIFFFEAALAVVMELQEATNKEYVYFEGGCVGWESHQIVNTPEMLQVLAEMEVTDSEREAALELAQDVFELFTEAMKELFGHSKTNSCNTVLQVSSISGFDRTFECLDICQ
ncbi:hypothetical protein [Tychonema sp. LEGE 07203]|uniref:hypothetical protein n=1 Tax=Tychonema sp. LEGE 07203 TaxID=1828671 RepID=UPI00187F441A|nr:hypothetical protein [Tychonema sp. LEGE 07203]